MDEQTMKTWVPPGLRDIVENTKYMSGWAFILAEIKRLEVG